jgi:hypothetical protein|tara:strand:- start:300 stop:911 length:612 start_codon:yes stop_codon:yes gene_type:complete
MVVRPIPSEASYEVSEMLKKAVRLLEKAEKLEMVEHDGKKVPAFAADGKGAKDETKKGTMAEKDKYCMKNFGKKYSECSAKEKAQCDKVHGKVEKGKGMCPSCGEKMDMEKGMCKMGCTGKAADMKKGEHHYLQSYGTKPEHAQFMIETGGQTYNSFYYTNQSLLDSDDVANKGASSHSVDLTALQPNMNPHENPVKGHLTEG